MQYVKDQITRHPNPLLDTDVWLDVCYHSNDAPPRYSSDLHPELLIAGAYAPLQIAN